MRKRNRPVEFWLEQIISMSDRMASHVGRMSAEAFVNDAKTVDAASWCISCIGEACGKILEIDPQFEHKHQGFELTAAYAARNRYVHGYFDLDNQQVWDTVCNAVPELAARARRILDDGS